MSSVTLYNISIIPLELYTKQNRIQLEQGLLAQGRIHKTEDKVQQIFAEIGGLSSQIYHANMQGMSHFYIAFHESSLCLCTIKETPNWLLEHRHIVAELQTRNSLHAAIIDNNKQSPVHDFLQSAQALISSKKYGSLQVNYVFSFYVIQQTSPEPVNKLNIMKLAEPSLIDMDDMLSTECDTPTCQEVKENAANYLQDVDISGNSETYISWATIVSICHNEESARKTIDLLIALEIRLQIIWNRCYAISYYIEEVFDNDTHVSSVDELFWSFSRTLDDAKSVLSSTFSSRIEVLFREMIKTSKAEGEINRLEQKISLLEKYIDQKNAALNKKYQKTIELLLFITAIASLAQVFFDMPISILPKTVELAIVILLTLLGIFAIFKSK